MKKTLIGNFMRVYLLVIAVAIAAVNSLTAACPVTHAFLAERFAQATGRFSSLEEKALFIQGVFFPDSRYFSERPRAETHFIVQSLEEILWEEDPFIAGMKHHSFVDNKRHKFLEKHPVLPYVSSAAPEEHLHTYIKLLEDEILWDQANRSCWLKLLILPCTHPKAQELTKPVWIRWEQFLQLNLTYRPQRLIALLASQGKGILRYSAQLIAGWNELFCLHSEDPLMQDYVRELILLFDQENAQLQQVL